MKAKPLEPPDSHHLKAVEGWLELGNYIEADAELKRISLENRFHPYVLLAQWQINAKQGNWAFAHRLAHALVIIVPNDPLGWVCRSYALSQMKRIREAWNSLLPAAVHFPSEWKIAYNLACYACQLGEMTEAWRWLDRAIQSGDADKIKSAALDDPDLKPLWAKAGAPPV